jgi:hypothetical protein
MTSSLSALPVQAQSQSQHSTKVTKGMQQGQSTIPANIIDTLLLPCGVRAARVQTDAFPFEPLEVGWLFNIPNRAATAPAPTFLSKFLLTMDQRYRKLSIVPRILVRKRGS